ncbi:hypothetical protein L7F22_067525 [Adiantum nelumboides]|nr:hypothetical protein [Adiantum nelumboides]
MGTLHRRRENLLGQIKDRGLYLRKVLSLLSYTQVIRELCVFAWRSQQMGGGNGQKAKMARERAQEKLKGAKGSQLESNKKAMSIQCKVCMQTFMCTTSEVKCREHAEAKHPKNDVNQCFPHLKA